jgi:hypothetical protein
MMMMGNITKLAMLSAAIAFLGACSGEPNGVRIVNGGTSAIPSKEGAKIGPIVVGKSFQFTRKDGTGFVVYNGDGSLTITDDQKGEIKGTWTTSGNQYCESYGAKPQECGVFKYTGDAYFAANSRLVEMKV